MDAQAVIALVASGLAAIIAVVVPQVTFRLVLRTYLI
jgi:TRAP-type C4-dicarboxylate transport system permease small subunit